MLRYFGLQEDWSLIRVLRCSHHHCVLLLKSKKTGVPEVIKIISRHTFNNAIYQELSHLSDMHLVPITKIESYRDWKLVFSPLLIPLSEYVQKEGLSLPEILRLMEQISTALSAMHDRNLLHLDISPDNIFMNEEGDFFLGDFCHARHKGKAALLTSMTPDYAAPEYADRHVTAAADQYSFAVLLYALLHNGSVPKDGQEMGFTLFSEKQTCSLKHGETYSEALYDCLEKALSPSPTSRYDSVSLFATEICACLRPFCRESSYRLQITDNHDAFFQVHTQLNPTQKKAPTKMLHKFAITFMLILLLTGFVWNSFSRRKSEMNYVSSVPTSSSNPSSKTTAQTLSSNNLPEKTTPAPATDSVSNILDISNRNADTMVELFDETLPEKDWNILFGENNCFTSLDELVTFSNLYELYLSGNRIYCLDAIASLENLKIAILSDNECTDVRPLCSLSNLTILDLSGNQELSQVSCLKTLTNLQLLILTDTSVSNSTIVSLQTALPNCKIVH